jgi:DDE superfamily endonuclease
MGWAPWEAGPVRQELTRQVAAPLGPAEGGWVFDPAGCPKSGPASGGVARQRGGRLGQVDPGQVALSWGSGSGAGPARVDMRLSVPNAWPTDQARLATAGGPHARSGSRSRHPWALDRLQTRGRRRPPGWSAGEDELGRPSGCRRWRAGWGARSRRAVPGNPWLRDRETALPEEHGRGRRPPRPWPRVDAWRASLAEGAWKRGAVRDGSQGPLVVDVVTRRVVARTPRWQPGDAERRGVRRDRDHPQVVQVDVSLSNAEPETPLWQLARGAQAQPRIEEGLQRRKRAAGCADYAVRHWTGWHQQHTLSLLAPGLLVTETLRGKKMDASADGTAETGGHRGGLVQRVAMRDAITSAAGTGQAFATQ